MKKDKATRKTAEDYEQELGERTADLQRIQANFENYRKHTEHDIANARVVGQSEAVKKLLPIIDIIDAATANVPADLANNEWVRGIVSMQKKLDKTLTEMKLAKMDTRSGDAFDHELHNAIQFDEAEGEKEVINQVLQPGYIYNDAVLRPALVSVTKK